MVVTWSYNSGSNTATASGAGSTNFAALVAADTAGGWGKFTADATGTQILCNAKIIIGDGTNTITFSDINKDILILDGVITANGQVAIRMRANATVTFGQLISSTTKATRYGCSFNAQVASTYYFSLVRSDSPSIKTSYLYSCRFNKASINEAFISASTIWNCIFDGGTEMFAYEVNDAYNVIFTATQYTLRKVSVSGTFDRIAALNPAYYGYFQTNGGTLSNFLGRGATGTDSLLYEAVTSGDVYLKNFDLDRWAFRYTGAASTCKTYRQYEFDLTTDVSATVVLKDNAGNTVFSVTSDGTTGAITTQTVSRGYYTQATGNTLQDYGPFTLIITKDGYQTYTSVFTLTEKTSLIINLKGQTTGTGSIQFRSS